MEIIELIKLTESESWHESLADLFATKVSLTKISKKIGFDEKNIISLLESSGFNDLNKTNIYLNDDHLKVLSKAYVKSIKSYYNSSSKNYFNLNCREQKELRKFFSKFIKKGVNHWGIFRTDDNLNKVLEGRLNNELIENYFDYLVYTISENTFFRPRFNRLDSFILEEFTEDERIFNKHKHFIKLKVLFKNLFNHIRIEIQSILICHHYYIFSDEDIHKNEVVPVKRFSHFMIIQREALKFIYNLKFQNKWKKTLAF
tara:strand:+ start:39 stop:812 length:774 start_codon:yes stop_codon:yes gene_type:complete